MDGSSSASRNLLSQSFVHQKLASEMSIRSTSCISETESSAEDITAGSTFELAQAPIFDGFPEDDPLVQIIQFNDSNSKRKSLVFGEVCDPSIF